MNNLIKYVLILIALGAISSLCTGCSDDKTSDGSAPVITDFYPKERLPATEVKITGSNFGENGVVYFNETKATEYVSYSNHEIVVKVPEGASTGAIALLLGGKYAFTNDDFFYIQGAKIENLSPAKAPKGETISILGKNFFKVGTEKIKVDFNGGLGTVISATSEKIDVIVPDDAVSGPVTLTFEGIQTIVGPVFTVGEKPLVVDDIVFSLWDYVTTSGNLVIDPKPANSIGSTKNSAYVIYQLTVPANAKYDVSLMAATNQSYNTYINVDMATDAEALGAKVVENKLSRKIVKQGWAKYGQLDYGTFVLKAGTTYYLKVTFLAEGTSWVGNVNDLRVTLAEDQNVEGIEVGSGKPEYTIYQNDFNAGTMIAPFSPYWAFDPNYIKVENQYLEFYYNQAALDADNRRERRGAEVTCNFKTTTEGWYGFKFFLPEGKFPKNTETHIAQVFQSGDCNSWAGFLSIKDETLQVSRRNSCGTATVEHVANITWGTWIPVVIHFKVSMMNTGMFQVWVGNAPKATPTYTATGINFGFGEWVNGETLDDVVSTGNPVADHIGCKFGMYCSTGGDRTIRFDDLKALVGSPTGAFELVKPGN